MEIHGITWEDTRTMIKMLKANRISTSHPNSTNTTKEDIDTAIKYYYPDTSSPWQIKAQQGLEISQLLATELQ